MDGRNRVPPFGLGPPPTRPSPPWSGWRSGSS